jgi:hypothetical protein
VIRFSCGCQTPRYPFLCGHAQSSEKAFPPGSSARPAWKQPSTCFFQGRWSQTNPSQGVWVPDKSQPKGKTYLCQANWAAECRAGCSPTSGVRGITGELLRHPLLFRQSWGRKKVCSPRNQPLATSPPCGPKWAMACHLAQLPLPGEKDPEQSRYLPLGRYKLPEGASEEPARQ